MKGDVMTALGLHAQQLQKMQTQPGFIAALDQSGGSTPNALRLYGIKEGAWSTEEEMFALVHQMRTRLITSPSFTGARILAAILFENTMDRDIAGQPTADYLWHVKRIVPFLKVDQGLAAEQDGVQLMKPMPALAALLDKARAKGIFGTKMRSVIKQANAAGITDIVRQQFDVAGQIIAAGLVPIIEPEVDIHCPDKAKAEEVLKAALLEELNALPAEQLVMLNSRSRSTTTSTPRVSVIPRSCGWWRCRAAIRGTKPTTACAGIMASWRAFRGPWSRG